MTAGRGAGITLARLGRCGNFQAEGGIDREKLLSAATIGVL